MKIDSYASLSSVIYFLIVYFDSPNIDLLYRNALPIPKKNLSDVGLEDVPKIKGAVWF